MIKEIIEYKGDPLDTLTVEIDTIFGGQYASTGWRHFLCTDGTVSIQENQWTQYGVHHDKYHVVAQVSGATWVVHHRSYRGQLYDYPDEIDIWGNPPENWRDFCQVKVPPY